MRVFAVSISVATLIALSLLFWFAAQTTLPQNTADPTQPAPYEYPTPAAPEPEPLPPPEPVLTPKVEPLTAIIPCFTPDEGIRKTRMYAVPCADGPAKDRRVLLPFDPALLASKEAFKLIVPTFSPFRTFFFGNKKPTPAPPIAKQGTTVFAYRLPHVELMGIENCSIYVMEESAGTPTLVFQGEVSLSTYRMHLGVQEPVLERLKPNPLIIESQNGDSTRRWPAHPTACIGGPLDGMKYPLLTDPQLLFDAGVAVMAISDADFPPKEPAGVFSRDEVKPIFVGHVSLYALERTKGAFQLRFESSVSSKEYLPLHNPKLAPEN